MTEQTNLILCASPERKAEALALAAKLGVPMAEAPTEGQLCLRLTPDGLYLESYDMEVEFGCKKMAGTQSGDVMASVSDVRNSVGTFLEYLRQSGFMKMYSGWTRTGRQNVRMDSVNDDAHWEPDEGDGQEFLVFKVKFKVNDPSTDVTLTA